MPGPYGVPQMGCGREGQGRAAARPPLQWAEVAREWMATQGPSESPSHLTVTAPCGGSGEHPNFKTEEGSAALRTDSNTEIGRAHV